MLRIIGGIMIVLGIVLSITIILAPVGVPMIVLGLLFILVGRKRAPIIVHINNSGNQDQGQNKT